MYNHLIKTSLSEKAGEILLAIISLVIALLVFFREPATPAPVAPAPAVTNNYYGPVTNNYGPVTTTTIVNNSEMPVAAPAKRHPSKPKPAAQVRQQCGCLPAPFAQRDSIPFLTPRVVLIYPTSEGM